MVTCRSKLVKIVQIGNPRWPQWPPSLKSILTASETKSKLTQNLISASSGTAKQFPEPRSTMDYQCDQWCVWPKMYWSKIACVVLCLSRKTISVPWFGRNYLYGGRAENSNKQPKTPSNPIAKVESRDLWRQPTKFAIAAILNFVSTSNFISILFSFYLQAKHDSFCA